MRPEKRIPLIGKNRYKSGLGLLGVLLGLLLLTVRVQAAEGVVSASSANIRKEPNAGSTVVASLLKDNKVSIKEEVTGTDGKKWYKIHIDADNMGYVRADLIKASGTVPTGNAATENPPAQNPAAQNPDTPTVNQNAAANLEGMSPVQPVNATVLKSGVRVRADNSTDSAIVTTVNKDLVLSVTGSKLAQDNKLWYLAEFNLNGTDVKGYIRSDFVTLSEELKPVEETQPPAETQPEENTPQEPPAQTEKNKIFDTREEEGVWYLYDLEKNNKYQIYKLLTTAEQNAVEISQQNQRLETRLSIIIILLIIIVLLIIGGLFLFCKLRDLMDEDGLDLKSIFTPKGAKGKKTYTRKRVVEPTAKKRTSLSDSLGKPSGRPSSRPADKPSGRPSGSSSVKPTVKPPEAPKVSEGSTQTKKTGKQRNFMAEEEEFSFEFLHNKGDNEQE